MSENEKDAAFGDEFQGALDHEEERLRRENEERAAEDDLEDAEIVVDGKEDEGTDAEIDDADENEYEDEDEDEDEDDDDDDDDDEYEDGFDGDFGDE